MALADCNESLRMDPNNNVGALNARGFVHLRLGRIDEAIADYDAAIKLYPKFPPALYGRGLARLKKGDRAGSDADIAAAKVIWPDVAKEFAKHGFEPSVAVKSEAPAATCGQGAGAAPQKLALIGRCMPVYCAGQTDQAAKDNLRHIDDRLAELDRVIAEYQAAVETSQRACRALGRVAPKEGPLLDAFRQATFGLGISTGRLASLYEDLRRNPDQDVFVKTAATMGRSYNQPACMNEIGQQASEKLGAAQALLDRTREPCGALP
jgi:tetratricopeptide (TPR) repeat protein